MSVLIKGMEMPTSCYVCPFCDYVSARCDAVKGTPYTPANRYEVRADWCPLVPVPPHGDLIGRNPLIDIAMHLRNRAKDEYTKRVIGSVIRHIAEAPTIIPAEEEGEG